MAITDLTPDFRAFWAVAREQNLLEQRRLWEAVYVDRHRDIFDLYFRDYASPDHIERALRRYPEAVADIDAISAVVVQHVLEDTPRLAALLRAEGHSHVAALQHVVLVGVFASDAWEARLHGRPTCFFAVERIGSPLAAAVTVAHEVTHGLHALVTPEIAAGDNMVGKSLFLEGVAVLASILAVSGLAETEYLWMGASQTPRGVAVREWAQACEAAWPELRTHLLRDFAAQDAPANGAYFANRLAHVRSGIPERAGYFVGYRLVAALAHQHSLAQMVAWPKDHALAMIEDALAHAESCPSRPSIVLPY